MSKDKYRPSLSSDEVVRRDLPHQIVPPNARGGSSFEEPMDEAEYGDGYGYGLVDRNAPQNLRIVSQTPYYSPEGQQFVEVVVAWDDVPGATEYLIRVGIG